MRIPETADFAIESERSSIRWFFVYSAVLFAAGIVILLIVFIVPSIAAVDGVKPLIAGAGTFISTMGGLPLKEVIVRNQRVRSLEWIKREASIAGADLQKLEEMLVDTMKKGTS